MASKFNKKNDSEFVKQINNHLKTRVQIDNYACNAPILELSYKYIKANTGRKYLRKAAINNIMEKLKKENLIVNKGQGDDSLVIQAKGNIINDNYFNSIASLEKSNKELIEE